MALPTLLDLCKDAVEPGGVSMEKPSLPPSFWHQLAANNPLGMTLTADDARAWFDLVWISYAQRGYRNHKRAIAAWWLNVREEEIDRARARVERISDEAETTAIEERIVAEEQAAAGIARLDHFSKLRKKRA